MPPDNSLFSRWVRKGRRTTNSTSDNGCSSDFQDPAATNISSQDSCSVGNVTQTTSTTSSVQVVTTSSSTITVTTVDTTSTANTVTVITTQDDVTTTTSVSVTPSTVEPSIQPTPNSQPVQSTESPDSETEVKSGSFAATSSSSSSPLFTSSAITLNPVVPIDLTFSSSSTSPPGAFGVSTGLPPQSTMSPDSSTNPSSSSSTSHLVAIAGSIAGAVALWLCFTFYCYYRRRRRRRFERTGSQEYLSPRGHATRPSDTSFFTPYMRQTPTPRPKIVIQTTQLPSDTLVSNPNANPVSAITPASDIHVYTDTMLLPSPEIAAHSPEPSEPDSDAYYTSEMDPDRL